MREQQPEPYITNKQAAYAVGAKYWQIRRLVKEGKIPSYTPYNSRKYVLLSEVLAYINSTRSREQ